jgi:hypothetical protein
MVRRPVSVRIFHPDPGPVAGPIERWVSTARATLAERHQIAFKDADVTDVAIVRGLPDDTPFGVRLRALITTERPTGLVILGSGAIPMAAARDYLDLVTAAGDERRIALANNRYSADVVAIACAGTLPEIPDLPGDNALPRWLSEVAGYHVADLRRRWRLAVDIDGPLELLLLGDPPAPRSGSVDLALVRARIAAVRAVSADRRAELIVAGRASVSSLAWLERAIPARIRAIVEERGLRAVSRLAYDAAAEIGATSAPRPPGSIVGMLLERDGPSALGRALARLGDAAIVDSRVLLAHRLGADESTWPPPEDRFASDLLLPERIGDPWLRELTWAAAHAPIPILLGDHSVAGPGVRLLLGRWPRWQEPWS